MHQGPLVFAQLMRHLPLTTFRRCVARYAGEHKVKSFSCLDQYLCMAFEQLTCRESLRELESSLGAHAAKLSHLGVRGNVSRNTLANANATRDWRIHADFARRLTGVARGLNADEPFGVDLSNTAYALDSTTIDLSPSLFPWAPLRTTKAAVKLRTLPDLRGNIPSFVHVRDGKLHDLDILDPLIPEAAIPPDGAGLRVVHGDGARFVANLVDAYDRHGISPSIADCEFLGHSRRILKDGRVFVMNLAAHESASSIPVESIRHVFGDPVTPVTDGWGGNMIVLAGPALHDRRRLAAVPQNARHPQQTLDLKLRTLPGLVRRYLQQAPSSPASLPTARAA